MTENDYHGGRIKEQTTNDQTLPDGQHEDSLTRPLKPGEKTLINYERTNRIILKYFGIE